MSPIAPLSPGLAAALFDAVVHGRAGDRETDLERFDVVAWPGATIAGLEPGDVVVRRARGEGRLAWAGTLADGHLYSLEEAQRLGLALEGVRPGLYAQCIESPARRVAGPERRLDLAHLVVRPASTREGDGRAEDVADDRARRDLREQVLDMARRRLTFVSEADARRALDRRASRAELRTLFDDAVAAAAAARRRFDAGSIPLRYWHLAISKGHIVFGAARIAALLERDRFACSTAGGALRVHERVVDAMRTTWRRTGERLSVGELCRATPARCPAPHDALHAPGDAAHFVSLTRGHIRVVELAGLFGLDLRPVPSADRPAIPAKQVLSGAPLDQLSFVAIRTGTQREVHVGRETPRRVESVVDGAAWRCFPFVARPGTDFVLFKRRWFEASFHRQWGTRDTVDWIIGLSNFYRDRTGLRLGVGDISHVVGEDITDHASHERGKDVDVYVLDDPVPGTALPVGYWCSGTSGALELRELVAPAADAAEPLYGTPPAGTAAIATPRSTTLFERYATIVAYCVVTQPLIQAVVWHGAPDARAQAVSIGQRAWDDVVAAGQGTTARPGWRASWGPGPANRAAITAPPAGLLVGEGSSSYGAGAAWPLHQDHIHIRLR